MANAIGIDFGTSRTMASYLDSSTGRVELVTFGCDRFVPTTVHLDENGQYLFGKDADEQIATDPEGYCRAFKLHLGESDSIMLRVEATAEELTRRFLGHIKEECEQNVFHGEPIDAATITVPVSFSPARKAALKRAAEAAGFATVSFLPEPEAAGIAFLRDNPTDKFSRALVLDWGGGTLDIAIISRDEDGTIHADSHCAEGRDDVGGEEMDRRLLEDISAKWKTAFRKQLLNDELDGVRFLRKSQETKEKLSQKSTAPFWGIPPKKLDVTRERFSQLIDEMLDSAVDLVKSALAKNKKRGNPAPDTILLIGGTSQVPAVREAMETNFPQLRVLSWHHSHEAVALGASYFNTPLTVQQLDREQDNSKNDNLEAVLELAGKILREKDGISKLGKKEADIINKAAQEGDSRAAGILASIYHDGCKGYRKNMDSSFHWAKIAAEAGDNRGQAWLAVYYLGIEENSPIRKNRPVALAWAEKAYARNKSLTSKALLMRVLASFDDPDIARIKRLGNGILKKVGDKAPDQFVLENQTAIGLSCFVLANLAIQNSEVEKAQDLLQKGVTFGSEDCAEVLSALQLAQEDEDEDDGEEDDWNTDNEDKKEPVQYPPTSSVPKNAGKSWGAGTGAVAGAAIGSIIPGIGTVAGGLIGFGIGLIKKAISD